MTDEDAEKFIMTPRFIDQIVYRTLKHQVDELVNILRYYDDHISLHSQKSEETYNRLYKMLTSVMNYLDRQDWLFVKNLYVSVQGGSEIIEQMEVIIKEYICGMLRRFFIELEYAEVFTSFCLKTNVIDVLLLPKRHVNG